MGKWRDQHLKTCTCRKCERRSAHVPDNPVLNAKAESLTSEYRDEIVYEGKSPHAGPTLPAGGLWVHPKIAPDSGVKFGVIGPHILKVDTEHNEVLVNPEVKTSPDATIWLSGTTLHISGTWKIEGCTFQATTTGAISWNAPTPWTPPAPSVELLESSNPFARALDAWQTGKAGWTKGDVFRRNEPQPEELSA